MPATAREIEHWTPIPDPTKLTTEQMDRAIASLKEVITTRLDAMDRAILLANNNLARVPSEAAIQTDHLRGMIEARLTGMDKAIELKHERMVKLPEDIAKQVDHLRGLIQVRLDGMDTANKLLQSQHDRIPLVIDGQISSLKGIHDEKFSSIQKQFQERDVRTEQSSKDSKVAVDAALQAAKEAVGEQNKSSALAIAKSEAATVKQIDQLGVIITQQSKNSDDKFIDLKERLARLETNITSGAAVRVETKTDIHADRSFLVSVISVIISVMAVASSIIYVSFIMHK